MSTETVGNYALTADLLGSYTDDCELFLATPRRTLLATETTAELAAPAGSTLAEIAHHASELLAETSANASALDLARGGPILVGALPFADTTPARLVVARDTRWGPPVAPHTAPVPVPPVALRVTPVPEPERYAECVRKALANLCDEQLRKVVLTRAIDVITERPVAVRDLLRRLALRDPQAYIFAVHLGTRQLSPTPRLTHRRVLAGASPELLVRRSGLSVISNPLAGSAARSSDPVEDRRRAVMLRESAKDLVEHRIVVDAVAEALRPLCTLLDVPAEPSLVRTAAVWHLSTRVRGVLATPAPSALTLAGALHPTPAVCGSPTALARRTIASLEEFDRRYYTGMTGWMNAAGEGEWVLALRCAEIEHTGLRLYAGAGIVRGSDPAAELAETSAKFRTLMSAIGVQEAC